MSKPPFAYSGGSIIDADGHHVAEVFGPSVDKTGAVLAASGDLLAACKAAFYEYETGDPTIQVADMLDSAIAKAEGRSPATDLKGE